MDKNSTPQPETYEGLAMKTVTQHHVSVLDLEGELTRLHLAEVRNIINGLVDREIVDVVLNFESVPHLDFTILGVLVEHQWQLKHLRGGLRLAGLSPYLSDVIRLMGIDELFESYESVEEALRSIHRGAPMRH